MLVIKKTVTSKNMETVIKNTHLLNGLLSETDLQKLTAGALQHKKFSRITFKILSIAPDIIKIQAVQTKCPHENYAGEITLITQTKELFNRFLPIHKVIVNATPYRPSVTEQVTPAYIRHRMTELKIKVKDIVTETGIDKTNVSAWINGVREMSQPVKAMFFYYFQTKQ